MLRCSLAIARKRAKRSVGGTKCLGEIWYWKWWILIWNRSNGLYEPVKSKNQSAPWQLASLGSHGTRAAPIMAATIELVGKHSSELIWNKGVAALCDRRIPD